MHGEKVVNPADDVAPAAIATFVSRDRFLSPTEIRIMLKQLEHVATLSTIRLGLKLILLDRCVASCRVQCCVCATAVVKTRRNTVASIPAVARTDHERWLLPVLRVHSIG